MNIRKAKYLFVFTAILLVSGVLYAVTEIQFFTARNEQESIVLEWKTGIEDNLNHFEIERSASNPNNFVTIGSLNAIGNNSYYTYRDELAMNPSPIYYYRLKLVDNNSNFTYSQTISVTHIISGVRSTWGSIKAIFR
jgi:hypothetical protein